MSGATSLAPRCHGLFCVELVQLEERRSVVGDVVQRGVRVVVEELLDEQ
jgi:hypothetical protein